MNKQSKLTKALVVATALSMPAFAHASQPANFANVAKAPAQATRTIDLQDAVALDMSDVIDLGRAIWHVITTSGGNGSGSGSHGNGNGDGGDPTGSGPRPA